MIHVETLGPVRVLVNGAPAPPELLWRKHLALVVYLARSARRGRSRGHLTALLWPDKEDASARHSLNEALRVIRKASGGKIVANGDQIALKADAVLLDVDQLEQRLAAGDRAGASALVLGDFLEGFRLPDASAFEDWLAAERTTWRGRGTAALIHHADEQLSQGMLDEALGTAEHALRLDPGSEAALIRLMKALALRGDRTGALARFDAFRTRSIDELGAEPSAEASAVAARIRNPTIRSSAPERKAATETLRRPPLVGRVRELGRLLESWQRSTATSKAEAALVIGDQGMGRSRLLEEFGARIALEGAVVQRIRAVPADQLSPWNGLLTLAEGLATAPGVAASPPEAIATLARLVPTWAVRFPAAGAAPEPWPLARAFGAVAQAVAHERPVALLVDDAAWLDDASLETLLGLVRDGSGAPLWVGFGTTPVSGRPGLERLASQLGRDVSGTAVSLGPLDSEALGTLVRWALPRYEPTDTVRLVRRLATDSAGIPLLAVELLHAVAHGMEPGAAAWPAPRRTLDQTLPGDLPPELVAAFRVSFRLLSAEGQSVLAAAAVLGGRVTAAQVAQVADLPIEGTLPALDELEWARWLEAEPRGYGFVARLAGEVVAQDLITPGTRQRLEARCQARV